MYLKILPLNFWFGRPASLPTFGLGLGYINRGTTVRYGEAEGFADVYLGTNKWGDKLELSTVFDTAYGAHFSQYSLC